jgi:hypothetical protein
MSQCFLFTLPTPSVNDALAAPIWLLANILLITAAWGWSRRLFPGDSFLELTIHTILLGWASIVAVAMTLGGTGLLSGWALLGIVSLLSLAALAINRPLNPIPLDRTEVPWLLSWAILFSIWIGHVITQGLFVFPTDWDSLAYHIPLVDQWLQSHSLWTTGCARWANPGNNELLELWAVGPFSGDFLLSLNNFPPTVLFACSGVELARRVGLPRPLIHLAGFALVCNFVIFKQLVDTQNDVAVAACFFATLYYALRHSEEKRSGVLALGAISLGLLAGVKYYALGYAALMLTLWVILTLLCYGRNASLRVLIAATAGILIFGGFWYARNWLMTGSPLYPRELCKHTDLLSQIYPDVASSSFFGNSSPELFELFTKAIWEMTGPCQLAGFLLVPFSLVWLIGSTNWQVLRSRDNVRGRGRLAIAMVLTGTGLLFGITPFAVEDRHGTLNQLRWYYCPVRYGLCFLSAASLAMLVLLRDLVSLRGNGKLESCMERPFWSYRCLSHPGFLCYVVFGGAIIYQFPRHNLSQQIQWVYDLLIAFILVLIGLFLVWFKHTCVRLRFVVLILTLLSWACACALLSRHWHQDFFHHFDEFGFDQLDENKRNGKVRILVLDSRCYPYFGSQRQHRVFQPTYVPNSDWIIEFIRTENINLIIAVTDRQPLGMRRFLGFDDCLVNYPLCFRLMEGKWTLFQVLETPIRDNP